MILQDPHSQELRLISVPRFPAFRRFKVDDASWYRAFYLANGLNPYADLEPSNLLVWMDLMDDLAVSAIDDAIVFRYTDVLGLGGTNLLPVAGALTDHVIAKVVEYGESVEGRSLVSEVPAHICRELNQTRWSIQPDRDSFEYILDVEEHAKHEGSAMRRRRNEVRQFLNACGDGSARVRCYNLADAEFQRLLLEHIAAHPMCSTDEGCARNRHESRAILRNLRYAKVFDKQGIVVSVESDIVALAIYAHLDTRAVSVNHLKADYGYNYSFNYTTHRLAQELRNRGIRELNLEQDLGIDGLRIHKSRLHPVRMLEKVRITPSG
jgi:hypothetical protein